MLTVKVVPYKATVIMSTGRTITSATTARSSCAVRQAVMCQRQTAGCGLKMVSATQASVCTWVPTTTSLTVCANIINGSQNGA